MFTVANLVAAQSPVKSDQSEKTLIESWTGDLSMGEGRLRSVDDDSRSSISVAGDDSTEYDEATESAILGPDGKLEFEPYVRRRNGTKSLKNRKKMSEPELQELRLRINSRERKRMHDLNSALDALRQVMPYNHGPSVRKLSKISTLLLARNYIVMLNQSVEELRRLVNTQRIDPKSLPGSSPPPSRADMIDSVAKNVSPVHSVSKSPPSMPNLGMPPPGNILGATPFAAGPGAGSFFPFPSLLPPAAFYAAYPLPISNRNQL